MFEQDIQLGPGTGTFTAHTIEILVMLLGAFLLGLWLGWVLWNRYKQEADRLRLDVTNLNATVGTLQTEMSALQGRYNTVESERAQAIERLAKLQGEHADLQLNASAYLQTIEQLEADKRQLQTDLALHTGEQDTIAQNAETEETPADTVAEDAVVVDMDMEETAADTTDDTVEQLDDDSDFEPIMEEPDGDTAASRSTVAPPDDDHFSDIAFESLTRTSFAPPAEAEAPLAPPVLTPLHQDDLKIVEGIGPKIEELLFHAGIHTYSELAAAPVSRLKEILSEAGSRYAMHDPGTWSAQALLAANGEWDNLKAYQEFLDAGKRPGK